MLEALFSKVTVLETCNFIKEDSKTLTQVLSYEICKLLKNKFFEEHP